MRYEEIEHKLPSLEIDDGAEHFVVLEGDFGTARSLICVVKIGEGDSQLSIGLYGSLGDRDWFSLTTKHVVAPGGRQVWKFDGPLGSNLAVAFQPTQEPDYRPRPRNWKDVTVRAGLQLG